MKEKRKEQIMTLLTDKGSVEVSELCKIFHVTTMTIRRDLDELRNDGRIARSHGGAILSDYNTLLERPFQTRMNINQEKKLAIALSAASLLEDGQKIFISSGSTTYLFARSLDNSRKLLVATDALNIASELVTRTNISVVLVGGELRSNTLSITGTFAEKMIRQFRYQRGFIGVTSIGSDGTLYSGAVVETGIYAAIFETVKDVIILADSTKLGVEDFVGVGNLGKGYTLVTNNDAPQSLIKTYRHLKANVITV